MMGRYHETYPHLHGDEARRQIEADRKAERAFIERETRRIVSELGVPKIKAARMAEQRRVKYIIERDKAERAQEALRDAANIEVAEGKFVNLSDTVVEPTPEWERHGETETFVPRQPDHTTRTIRTRRRVQNAYVRRLWRSNKLNDDQYRTCLWYRSMHEAAGLVARCKTSKFSAQVTGGDALFGHLPMTMRELEARRVFRSARNVVGDEPLKFFEKVVIEDVSLVRASGYARFGQKQAISRFWEILDRLLNYMDEIGIDVSRIDPREVG